ATLSQLVEQTLDPSADPRPVDYGRGSAGGRRGWFLRLVTAAGERLRQPPRLQRGRVVFETTTDGVTALRCSQGASQGIDYLLDPFSGAPATVAPTLPTHRGGEGWQSGRLLAAPPDAK